MTKKKEIVIVSFWIIIQTIIFIIVGMNKEYIHMDEAYSLGLASYEKTEIQTNEDFYDQWHGSEYYEDYLSVQDDEIGQYRQVYENQKNDVHPPIYYFLLRISMGFTKGHFSMWSGLGLNIIIFAFVTFFTYSILKKILSSEKRSKEKAIILAAISSITISSLSNVIYIRMYALLTLMILITIFLHMKLLEKPSIMTFIWIGVTAFIGSLTHYYYLIYLGVLYIIFLIKYIREKNLTTLFRYTLPLIIAAIMSLVIFPYSIQHMFFGYRGEGVINNLTNGFQFLSKIGQYLLTVNRYAFHNLLFIVIAGILVMILILMFQKKPKGNLTKNSQEHKELLKIISIPTICYFIMIAIASPWIELRYVMPICGLIFIVLLYNLYKLLKTLSNEKTGNIIMIILFCCMFLTPWIDKIEPDVLYRDKREVVQKLEYEWNVPTLYLFNSQNNRFLDDILLFTKLNESYIAKDMEYTNDNIRNILKEKDTSHGIILFINEGQDHNSIIQSVKKSIGLKSTTHIKRLNACDVYYIN